MSIKIDLKIFLFAIIFCFTKQIEIYSILMLLAIIHELSHLIAGLIIKYKPYSINITPFGLQIEFKTKCEDYNKKIIKGSLLCLKRIFIAVIGPITNMVIGLTILFGKLNVRQELWVYSNFIIGIFNLLPIYPLDGGRILKEILHIFLGLEKSYIYINKVANATMIIFTIVCSIAILYLKNIALFIINIYLWTLVASENRKFEIWQNVREKLKKSMSEY